MLEDSSARNDAPTEAVDGCGWVMRFDAACAVEVKEGSPGLAPDPGVGSVIRLATAGSNCKTNSSLTIEHDEASKLRHSTDPTDRLRAPERSSQRNTDALNSSQIQTLHELHSTVIRGEEQHGRVF